MTLDDLMKLAFKGASKIINRGEEAKPAFLILMPDDRVDVILAPWTCEAEKQLSADVMRGLIQHSGATAYAFACEAWLRRLDNNRWDGVMPRNAPDRIDVLNIMGRDKSGKSATIVAEVIKTASGRAVGNRLPIPDDLQTAGRMANFFGPEMPTVIDEPQGRA